MSSEGKRIAILGSTGSIGRQTLDIVRALPDRFSIVALGAGRNVDLLVGQIREFTPKFFCSFPLDNQVTGGQPRLDNIECEFLSPEDIARHPQVDVVVIATSGKVGLAPILAAVKAGKTIALANKESLVMAGEIITAEMERSGARILPVDSEHSAIWQCLNGENQEAARIILTASGGPFRRYSAARLRGVTVAQALEHPSWQMGKKVTVDSATLMNKGLEIIEARWLFSMPVEKIEVLIHPQSIIHSMVEFIDGSVKAQLSCPDMRLPIQYALSYPDRIANPSLPRIQWKDVNSLEFEQPDFAKFTCLRLAIEAGRKGGTYPTVLCAADEVAVELFLSKRIRFTDIGAFVEKVLEQHRPVIRPTIEEIIAADSWAREKISGLVNGGG
ncbi:1-deoxy-D-xylulose-5-phosphate reductoisomerase [Chloroflexota bacterium]